MRLVIVLAEGNELLADDVASGFPDVVLHGTVRLPGPDVIAADQVPARRLLDVGKPVDRRPALPARRLADRHHAGRALAAFIDRRIDVGDAMTRGDVAQADADRAGVQPDDEIELVERDRLLGAVQHLVERPAGVVDRQLDLAAEDADALVNLGNGELRAVGRAGAPHAWRSRAADEAADAQLVRATPPEESTIARRQRAIGARRRQIPQQQGRRHRRTAVSREVYRRVHANSCLAPDLKAQ